MKKLDKPLGMSWRDVYLCVRACERDVEKGVKTPEEAKARLQSRGISDGHAKYARKLAKHRKEKKEKDLLFGEIQREMSREDDTRAKFRLAPVGLRPWEVRSRMRRRGENFR